MTTWLVSVDKLKAILDKRKDLSTALQSSIQNAAIPEVPDIPAFYQLLIRMLSDIPTVSGMNKDLEQFHYLTSRSPHNFLYEDETFSLWLKEFAADHGSFLDTPDSATGLDDFIKDPSFHIDEYDPGPGGWFTFNQFFTRQVKPGMRPISDLCNDDVIVSPCDGTYLGCWKIDDQASVTAKGHCYKIHELLEGSRYKDVFRNGVFTHTYLDSNDYHRYHVPVRGVVSEIRKYPGRVIADTIRKEDGSFTTLDEVGFQFRQTRGCMIMESPVGMVAIIPVGMGHVSSVNITAAAGLTLHKGEEFGYFAYGGSDMIMLFQSDKVEFTAEPNVHYKQGELIAVQRRTA
jgi:phosphatidylserine decarboxylase precursor